MIMNEKEFPMQPLPPNERAFLEAAKAGDVGRLKPLLDKGVPVDVQDVEDMPWNQTALMYAAQKGHLEALKFLLRAGARVFARDEDLPGEPAGRQPLHYAVRGPSLEVIEALLAAGANPNAMDSKGYTPVNTAISAGNLEGLKLLLKRGGNINMKPRSRVHFPPLCSAAIEEKPDMVDLLLQAGADVNATSEIGSTPLIMAGGARDQEAAFRIAESLVRSGAEVNRCDDLGNTSLLLAAINKNFRVMELLISAGADVNRVYEDPPGTLLDTTEVAIQARRKKLSGLTPDHSDRAQIEKGLRDWEQIEAIICGAGAKRAKEL